MQLALIPPSSMKSWILQGDISLMLPWQMKELPADFVRTVVTENYTILDNGAAERRLMGWPELIKIARQWEVPEVVVPDRLSDCNFSIGAAMRAKVEARDLLVRGVKLMAVAQGQTMAEVMKCIYSYAGMSHISVIGLPRILNMTFAKTSRAKLAEALANDKDLHDVPLHCLGSFYPHPQEVRALAPLPNVRSMDTSLPWVYGCAHRAVTDVYPRRGLIRKPNYFEYQVSPIEREYCERNARTLLRWAQAPSS